jgi:hypothetical protein
LFVASSEFLFFDYFRVPYRLSRTRQRLGGELARHPLCSLEALYPETTTAPSAAIYWPRFHSSGTTTSRGALPAARYRVESTPFYASVLSESECLECLGAIGGEWKRAGRVRAKDGASVSSVWRSVDGGTFLPFDPGAAIRNFWCERYRDIGTSLPLQHLKRLVLRSYYRARPVLPRATQIWLRRVLARAQAKSAFPRWPIETALHDLYDLLFRYVAELVGEPVPWISSWPGGHSWAIVLTHDVETEVGYRNVSVLRDIELEAGYRSSWNFVPKRYVVGDDVVDGLKRAGFEVGVHGLHHDGRDLESWRTLSDRLPAMRSYAERWQAVGFRSPATHRVWEWMPLLGFEYDSSYPDTDPFEPQAGGCCSWLPFFNEGTVELPITLPQDHTLFTVLRHADETVWAEKAEYVKARGGMALLVTHPDYLDGGVLARAYRNLLDRFRTDGGAWRALPKDVNTWWRRRASSHLERVDGTWRVAGPASAEATITYATPVAVRVEGDVTRRLAGPRRDG